MTDDCDPSLLNELSKSAKSQKYAALEKRKESFKTWQNDKIDCDALAQAGFFFQGRNNKIKLDQLNITISSIFTQRKPPSLTKYIINAF